MIPDRPLLTLLCAGVLLSSSLGAAEPLRHDVFARPTLAELAVAKPESPAAVPQATWNPKLTAVMVAGSRSLATIDGRIIRIGEEADGFRLVAVREGEAIVSKEGQRYTLSMPPPGGVAAKNRGAE